jgi:hypothetical protein
MTRARSNSSVGKVIEVVETMVEQAKEGNREAALTMIQCCTMPCEGCSTDRPPNNGEFLFLTLAY